MKIVKAISLLLLSIILLPLSSVKAQEQPKNIRGQVFLSTQNDVDFTDTINIAKQSENKSLLGLFNARSYLSSNLIVSYGVFPQWAIRLPRINDNFLKYSLDFYQATSDEQKMRLPNGLKYHVLSPLQQTLLTKIFVENPMPDVLEPDHYALRRSKTFEDITGDTNTTIQLSASPFIFLYAKGSYLGKIAYDCCGGFPATNKSAKLDTVKKEFASDVGILSWVRFPERIEPPTQVQPDMANRTISFGRIPQTMTVEEVLRHIDPMKKQLIANKDLGAINVVIYGEDVKVVDVIRALNIAIGSQSRNVGSLTFISHSQIHQLVSESALTILDSVYTRNIMAQGFSQLIKDSVRNFDSPFAAQYFIDGNFRKFGDLSIEEQKVLKSAIGEVAVDELELLFVPAISARISNAERGTSLSSFISVSPPDAPLKQPAGNTWNLYAGESFEENNMAKIVFDSKIPESQQQ